MGGGGRILIIVIITVYHSVTMDRRTSEQRVFAATAYLQNDESFIQTRRVFDDISKCRTTSLFRQIMQFER